MRILSHLRTTLIAAACFAMIAVGPNLLGQDKGDAAKGKEVFDSNCSVCHNADSTEKKMGPGLKGLFKRSKLANGKPMNEANVRAQINEGGGGMPAYSDMLSAEEKDNLIAYLKTL
ncbi:MAG TPA: cytochrome c [Bryobacteraceae bacterium]|jgi:cytochrome c|nr:cytochrome c [Bryobacteraceae bacterium]